MALVCKYCGYKQYDEDTIESYKKKYPDEEEYDIPYVCGACQNEAEELAKELVTEFCGDDSKAPLEKAIAHIVVSNAPDEVLLDGLYGENQLDCVKLSKLVEGVMSNYSKEVNDFERMVAYSVLCKFHASFKECSNKLVVTDIEWDTDGVSVDDLPETITIDEPTAEMVAAIGSDDYSDDYNVIADYLSDSYGWCVKNFRVHFKPECKLIGEDGNIFNLMGIASRILRENGMKHEAEQMHNRIVNTAKSYEKALAIIGEYVEIV